jgi:hypothetical protein
MAPTLAPGSTSSSPYRSKRGICSRVTAGQLPCRAVQGPSAGRRRPAARPVIGDGARNEASLSGDFVTIIGPRVASTAASTEVPPAPSNRLRCAPCRRGKLFLPVDRLQGAPLRSGAGAFSSRASRELPITVRQPHGSAVSPLGSTSRQKA